MDATTVAPSAVRSLSQPVPPWRITLATVIKGLQVAWRYLPNLIGSFVGLAVRIVFFLLIANTASFGASGEQSIMARPVSVLPGRAAAAGLQRTDAVGADQRHHHGPVQRHAGIPLQQPRLATPTTSAVLTEVVISLTDSVPFYLFLIWYAAAGAINMALILLVAPWCWWRWPRWG